MKAQPFVCEYTKWASRRGGGRDHVERFPGWGEQSHGLNH